MSETNIIQEASAINKAQKKTEEANKQIEAKLIEKGLKQEVVKKLMALGSPFLHAIGKLGFETNANVAGSNPILAFVMQDYVQKKLLMPGLLNADTFKTIYNTVAKRLIADSEFFATRNYNIIYCPDFYKKSSEDRNEYLTLQKSILRPTSSTYDAETQLENKKIFFATGLNNGEPDLTKLASVIKLKRSNSLFYDMTDLTSVKLNSLALAEAVHGAEKPATVEFNSEKQDKLVKELNSQARIFVALMSLSLSTKSKAARDAVAKYADRFKALSGEQIADATAWLAKSNTIPKGQMQTSDADALVYKLCTQLLKL